MENMIFYAVPLALAAVAIVLIIGLYTMLKGNNPNRSQKLMRLRIVMQAIAIVVIMTAIYLAAK